MKKNFINPELEIVMFYNEDIITKSGDMEGGEFGEDDVP